MESRSRKKTAQKQNNIINFEAPNNKDKEKMAAILQAGSANLGLYFSTKAYLHLQKNTTYAAEENELVTIGINLYLNEIFLKNYQCLIARSEVSNEVLGLITYYQDNTTNFVNIDVLAVAPHHRKKRIAPILIGKVIEYAASRNQKITYVKTDAMGESHSFWQKYFYGVGEVFYLHKERFRGYFDFVATNKVVNLFPFIAETRDIRLIYIINTTKNAKLLQAAHIFSHYLADDQVGLAIDNALPYTLNQLMKMDNFNLEEELLDDNFYKLFKCMLTWLFYNHSKINLNEIVNDLLQRYTNSENINIIKKDLHRHRLVNLEELTKLGKRVRNEVSESSDKKIKRILMTRASTISDYIPSNADVSQVSETRETNNTIDYTLSDDAAVLRYIYSYTSQNLGNEADSLNSKVEGEEDLLKSIFSETTPNTSSQMNNPSLLFTPSLNLENNDYDFKYCPPEP